MTTFFTADTHYNHGSIIKHCNRPFSDVDDMNANLIAYWNITVGRKDTVYVLGDFGFATRDGWDLEEVFKLLKGHKHLIVGNHDEKNPKVLKLPWESMSPLATIRDNGMRAVACHYPLETWKNASGGHLMLHGHSHGTLKRYLPHRFDVGVDVLGFRPVAFERIWASAQLQRFQPTDHHGD